MTPMQGITRQHMTLVQGITRHIMTLMQGMEDMDTSMKQ